MLLTENKKLLRALILLLPFIIVASAHAGSGSDSYTVLLLHADGGNATTVFSDAGVHAHSVTANGNAQISTAQSKFGGSAISCDGAGDYLTVGNSSDWEFGSGNFTVDWWEYRTSSTGAKTSISRDQSTLYVPFILGYGNDPLLVYMTSDSSGAAGWDIAGGQSLGSLTLNAWHHFAVVRSGNTFYAFKDGTQTATWTSSASLAANSNPLSVCSSQGGGYYQGYIDELRVSKGTARWTASFTPPTAPYGGNEIKFTSNVTVTGDTSILGTVSKGSGSFVIDHPLDPKNKLLYHSFVESPDVKNIYDGIATLDKNGDATIELPRYFLALNKDFRYLGTAIGQPMPNLHLAKEVRRYFFGLFGKIVFKISGGAPNGRVSWQVTGIRKDPFILANPIVPEVEKGSGDARSLLPKGECLFAPLCAK